MIDRPRIEEEDDDAPELHNAEQDDEDAQAQTLAGEALHGAAFEDSPLDSEDDDENDEDDDGDTRDLIEVMRDMEDRGEIDMGAFGGEPNMDDEDDAYGDDADSDDE